MAHHHAHDQRIAIRRCSHGDVRGGTVTRSQCFSARGGSWLRSSEGLKSACTDSVGHSGCGRGSVKPLNLYQLRCCPQLHGENRGREGRVKIISRAMRGFLLSKSFEYTNIQIFEMVIYPPFMAPKGTFTRRDAKRCANRLRNWVNPRSPKPGDPSTGSGQALGHPAAGYGCSLPNRAFLLGFSSPSGKLLD